MKFESDIIKQREAIKVLEEQLQDPSLLADPKKLKESNQEYKRVKNIVNIADRYEKASYDLEGAKETANSNDAELKAMAEEEIELLTAEVSKLEEELDVALLPPDPMDNNDVIIEVRAGTGGDEAALFAGDLMRMYSRYAETQGWKVEILSSSQNEIGGYKEVIFSIKGGGAYGHLKYESGVHRVQRVPETEKQGRIHTSTATVYVLPEIEENDLKIDPKDLKIEATTSTGAGGQSVNTAYSAIRIVHIPTGIMVYCQEERSQRQNKERALQIIRARVYDYYEEQKRQEQEAERRSSIGTGARSEKIRTYNYPQDRITDHRIKESWNNINSILDGGFDDIIKKLKKADREEQKA